MYIIFISNRNSSCDYYRLLFDKYTPASIYLCQETVFTHDLDYTLIFCNLHSSCCRLVAHSLAKLHSIKPDEMLPKDETLPEDFRLFKDTEYFLSKVPDDFSSLSWKNWYELMFYYPITTIQAADNY